MQRAASKRETTGERKQRRKKRGFVDGEEFGACLCCVSACALHTTTGTRRNTRSGVHRAFLGPRTALIRLRRCGCFSYPASSFSLLATHTNTRTNDSCSPAREWIIAASSLGTGSTRVCESVREWCWCVLIRSNGRCGSGYGAGCVSRQRGGPPRRQQRQELPRT